MADELGTDPSPETTALHVAILRGELATPVPDPAAIAPSGLIGRDDELAYLDAVALRARAGSFELAVISGEAGIGKTALLRAWAGRRAAAGETVLFASCGPLDQALPLDALLSALGQLLRRLGPEASADLLDADATLMEPALGTAPAAVEVPMLADSAVGPAMFYSALLRVLGRLGMRQPVTVVIDDAHLAGPALGNWLRFARRGDVALMVVAAIRPGEGAPLPGTALLDLDVLDHAAVAELVGAARADALYARSKGHPLFLTELAQRAPDAELPASLVESVSARCDELGTAGALLRTAAVIGPELDVDLLAAVLGRSVVDLLDDAELAVAKHLLVDEDGVFRFRHELVREALAASATAGRSALLHRQAGRVLSRRHGADPVTVARHARLGGDLALAASALREAASVAAERFDHAAAEALLDDALALQPDAFGWLARARVRTRRGRYAEALADVELAFPGGSGGSSPREGAAGGSGGSSPREGAAGGSGGSSPREGTAPEALEVGAWAAYFDRRFAQAARFAQDGALAAVDAQTRARCLAVGGRTQHAAGDLAAAEMLLGEAFALAEGSDRITAAAWLGVLRAHQSRADEALALLRPASHGHIGVEHTAATLHSLLFTGHVHAIAGRPALALEAFTSYTAEVDRRQVPRFAGRAVNFAGWVLRNLGATGEALDHHRAALEVGRRHGTAEVTIAALEDIAEQALHDGTPDEAAARLTQARELLRGDLVFGWRLELKHLLLSGRLALLRGDGEAALRAATDLESRSAELGIPRYLSVARLLVHRARRCLGLPVDLPAVERDLDAVDRVVAIEAWWWTGDVAADLGVADWVERALTRADRLASAAGSYADGLRQAARRRADSWRAAIG